MLFRYLQFVPLLQSDLAKKGASKALHTIEETTDAVLTQANLTVKLLWGMTAIMLVVIVLIVAAGVLGYKGWTYLKSKEAALDTEKTNAHVEAGLDASKVDVLSERIEGLVKLLQKSAAVDQQHSESHTQFVQTQYAEAQVMIRELFATIQTLQQNAREQDKESINMAGSLRTALEVFSRQLTTLQESMVSSIGIRDSYHTEICSMLKAILTILSAQSGLKQP